MSRESQHDNWFPSANLEAQEEKKKGTNVAVGQTVYQGSMQARHVVANTSVTDAGGRHYSDTRELNMDEYRALSQKHLRSALPVKCRYVNG